MTNNKAFQEDPENYWNGAELMKVPAWREAPYPDSKFPGLQDLLIENGPETPGNREFFAYLGLPESPMPKGGYPGIVLIHGGGGTAFPEYVKLWNSRGYAVIALDWYQQRPVPDAEGRIQAKLPLEGGATEVSFNSPDKVHVDNVAKMVRCHSLLRSLPQVNPERTCFIGLSWGSWYGAMVAAVDDRFKLGIEIYCGDVNKVQVSPKSFALVNGRFHHAIKVPMYWIAGTNDQHVVPAGLRAAFQACPTLVNRTMVTNLPHGHEEGFVFKAVERMADAFLKDGVALPRLGMPEFSQGILRAPVLSEGMGNCRAKLCYTDMRDVNGDYNVWFLSVWHEMPASLEDGFVLAEVPRQARQCFLALYDQEDIYRTCCGTTDPMDLP